MGLGFQMTPFDYFHTHALQSNLWLKHEIMICRAKYAAYGNCGIFMQ